MASRLFPTHSRWGSVAKRHSPRMRQNIRSSTAVYTGPINWPAVAEAEATWTAVASIIRQHKDPLAGYALVRIERMGGAAGANDMYIPFD